jgi:hypothetical protein
VQIFDADSARLDGRKARAFEQPDGLRGVDVSVPVMEVSCKPLALRRGFCEINDQDSSTRLHDSPQLGSQLTARYGTTAAKHTEGGMMMEAGESKAPQFATAEYATNSPKLQCAGCRQPISSSYFRIKSSPVCAGCTEKVRAKMPKDSHGAFVRAVAFGIAGALIGLALYVAFALATGLIIGWVSLAVGWIVGKAMRMGSGGVGGRRYQVVAVLLTYFAVSMSAVPIALYQSGRMHHIHMGRVLLGRLAWLGIASPILGLRDTVSGLIGLVILFVGIRFAWRFTAGQTLQVSGPFTAASAGAT